MYIVIPRATTLKKNHTRYSQKHNIKNRIKIV